MEIASYLFKLTIMYYNSIIHDETKTSIHHPPLKERSPILLW